MRITKCSLPVLAVLAAQPVFADQAAKTALIEEMLTLSSARDKCAKITGHILDQQRGTNSMRRLRMEQHLQPADGQQKDKKKELGPLFDDFDAGLMDAYRKAMDWESLKPRLVAAYDELFSQEELAGIVAFYKTPTGQAFVNKMPDFATRIGQLAASAIQGTSPEFRRLTEQLLEKAKPLGYTWTNTAADNAAVIGGIIGSVPTAAPPPPPPSFAGTTDNPPRIRVGDNVQSAKLIHQTNAVYPPLAKAGRITGHVILNAIIAKDGTIENLTVASGHPLLVPAAMEAVKQWVYQPTLLNNEPVEVITQIDVNFTLSQ